jgi:hypothetical protein
MNKKRLPLRNLTQLQQVEKKSTDNLFKSAGYIYDIVTGGQFNIVFCMDEMIIVHASSRNTDKMNEIFESNVIDHIDEALCIHINTTENQSFIFHSYGFEVSLQKVLMESISAEKLRVM